MRFKEIKNKVTKIILRVQSTDIKLSYKKSKPSKLDPIINFATLVAEIMTHQNIFDKNLDQKGLIEFLADVINDEDA